MTALLYWRITAGKWCRAGSEYRSVLKLSGWQRPFLALICSAILYARAINARKNKGTASKLKNLLLITKVSTWLFGKTQKRFVIIQIQRYTYRGLRMAGPLYTVKKK